MSGFGHLLNAIAGVIQLVAENRQRNERDAVVHFNRAAAKARRSDYVGAVADCDRAIAINPNYADAYSFRGLNKSILGNLQGAITDFDHAITLNPNNADYYHRRGNCKAKQRDHDGAITDLDCAIYLNPHDEGAYAVRGAAKMAKNDHDGAIADYDQAIAMNPHDSELYFNRGITKVMKVKDGHYAEEGPTVEDLDRAIQEDLGEAIADFNNTIALTPDNQEAYKFLSLAQELKRR